MLGLYGILGVLVWVLQGMASEMPLVDGRPGSLNQEGFGIPDCGKEL